MEYIIKGIPEKIHNISEEESSIIKRAIPFYSNLLERYENTLLKAKEENDKIRERQETDNKNPFDIGTTVEENYIPNINEIKAFVYSAWAKTIADVQTPYVSSGQKKKGIMKRSFRDVQNGKYINKNVRQIMKDFISKVSIALDIKEHENNDD